MSVGETERERKEEKKGERERDGQGRGEREAQLWGIRGSWDHGGKLAASKRKWRPLTSAKEWQFRDKKNAQTYLEGYLLAVRAAAKVMKFCSSTSLDTAQVIIVCCCLSGDLQQWTGCFRVFDTRAEWGWPAHSIETCNIPSLSVPVNVLCSPEGAHTGSHFIYHLSLVLTTRENIIGVGLFNISRSTVWQKTKQKNCRVKNIKKRISPWDRRGEKISELGKSTNYCHLCLESSIEHGPDWDHVCYLPNSFLFTLVISTKW